MCQPAGHDLLGIYGDPELHHVTASPLQSVEGGTMCEG
jgi:hypothetical protein